MITGARFAKWGLGLFIFGMFLTFGIIAHYCAGSRWPNGELFMQNITLWWACPWTLSVAAVQAGGLGMVAIGLRLMLAARVSPTPLAAEGSVALRLCIVGLLGVFAVGYPGYFVFDAIWPGYYYSPIATGNNAWLLGQTFFIAMYFAGATLAFNTARRALDAIPAAASFYSRARSAQPAAGGGDARSRFGARRRRPVNFGDRFRSLFLVPTEKRLEHAAESP